MAPPLAVGAEIVLDQNDALGVGEVDVGQVFQDASVIHGGMAICDLDVAPTFERSKHHEEISTKPFRPSKPGAWSSASNGTTLQNTAAGSIWPSLNSAS